MKSWYALVDCNSFYASCEQAFVPALRNRPVVVLSNNDGCVIARSGKAKEIGIAMGVPYWEVKHTIKKYGVKVFSSNYPLYGSMSNRVMSILHKSAPEVEIYSIDEAFLKLEFWNHSSVNTKEKVPVMTKYTVPAITIQTVPL